MIETHGGLNEPLIEPTERPVGFPPQVLPSLVGLVVPAFVKKIYTGFKEWRAVHWYKSLRKLGMPCEWAESISESRTTSNAFLKELAPPPTL
jgi:hypothetical protein